MVLYVLICISFESKGKTKDSAQNDKVFANLVALSNTKFCENPLRGTRVFARPFHHVSPRNTKKCVF
jgi:hypothetical protein